MNVIVWTLQIVLAFLYLAGGSYKAFSHAELLKGSIPFSGGVWIGLGVPEVVGALLLIAPAALRWIPMLTPLAAVALAVETLTLATPYARYSLALTVENPMTWAIAMGLLAVVVAWGTYARYANHA
jgi:hypothetical protein